jgi:RNA polymerase sigma-70 factor (ECF subfamily)
MSKNQQEEFSLIYDKYIEPIFRFVYLKVDSKEAAQDLTSDTFLRFWNKFKENEDKIDNPRAFLYKTARNLVVDYYRLKGRLSVVSLENSPELDSGIDLNQKFFLDSEMEKIKRALSKIKDDYQDLIIWHYLDELSIKECSQLLNKTEGATRVMLSRALKSLKEEFEKIEPDFKIKTN